MIDGGLESQVADASELALFDREVWFVKTRSFETTPQGVTKIYNGVSGDGQVRFLFTVVQASARRVRVRFPLTPPELGCFHPVVFGDVM